MTAGRVIRVGMLFSVTGPYRTIGQAMRNGALLAVEEINRDQSYPFSFEAVGCDPGGDGLDILLGAVGAYWATTALRGMLFEIDARDPLAFVLGAVALLGVALGAAWIPARRASRVPPISALTES